MSKTNYHISDYSIRFPDGTKFDYLGEYTDEQWLLAQSLIDVNAQERRRQEKKSDQDFKIAMIFVSCLGLLSLSFFVGVITSSIVAVNQLQQFQIQQNQ